MRWFKKKSKLGWYDYLSSSEYLTVEDKVFLDYYADSLEFQKVFPYWFLVSSQKLYLYNSLQILKNWISTEELKYIPYTGIVRPSMMVKVNTK